MTCAVTLSAYCKCILRVTVSTANNTSVPRTIAALNLCMRYGVLIVLYDNDRFLMAFRMIKVKTNIHVALLMVILIDTLTYLWLCTILQASLIHRVLNLPPPTPYTSQTIDFQFTTKVKQCVFVLMVDTCGCMPCKMQIIHQTQRTCKDVVKYVE